MDRKTTLKMLSKYCVVIFALCILTENYICSRRPKNDTFHKFKKRRKLETNPDKSVSLSHVTEGLRIVENVTQNLETQTSKQNINVDKMEIIFKRRRLHVQNVCKQYKQELANNTG